MTLSDTLPRLATTDPVEHTISIIGRPIGPEQIGGTDWTTPLPTPTSWSLSFDETTRPYASLTLTYPRPAFDWGRIDPTSDETRMRLRITLGYRWPAAGDHAEEQTALVIMNTLDDDEETGTVTITASSDESLLDEEVRPGRLYEVPDWAVDVATVWDQACAACLPMWKVPIRAKNPVAPGYLEGLRNLQLASGDKFDEFAWTLADTCGLWLHSDQSPQSQGGLIAEARRGPASRPALDLTPTSRYPITKRRRTTKSLADYASHLALTVHWKDGDDQKEISKLFKIINAPATKLVSRDLTLRPPRWDATTRYLPDGWPPAMELLYRLQKRTWTQTIDARSCYWLRPRDTVLTTLGPALIGSVSFDGSTGLMTITARPY